MKRRDILQAGVATVALSSAGAPLSVSADDAATNSSPLTKTDPNLIQSIDAIFGEHMDAELAGDLDKTLATMSLP
tara:strand:- start:6401 stop:6625 length:225 start_codon:yes stop_codon:yes gene_type:complete